MAEQWQRFDIEQLATFNRGVSWRSDDSNSEGQGIPVVSIPNIQNGKIKFENIKHYLTKEVKEINYLQENDILFVGSSGSIHNVARSAIVKKAPSDKTTHASFTFRARPYSNVVFPLFLFYLLNNKRSLITPFVKRAADGKYNFQLRDFVNRTQITLPSLSEQKRIAKTLSTIQEAIETQDKIIGNLRELKKVVMEKVFTKGLDGEKTKQTEIGEMPEGWEIDTVETLFYMKQGKSLSARKQTGEHLKPFLRTSNVLWGKLDMSKVDEMDILPDEQETLELKQDDLLVCEGGDIGRTAIWKGEIEECYYQNHIHRLRAKNGDIDPVFYMYWFQFAIQMKSIYGTFGNRTTIPNLSGKTLSRFALPRPSLSEQKRITETIRAIDKKIEHHENKKATLQDFFKVALNDLMKGENSHV